MRVGGCCWGEQSWVATQVEGFEGLGQRMMDCVMVLLLVVMLIGRNSCTSNAGGEAGDAWAWGV